jgi:hypothetical protein
MHHLSRRLWSEFNGLNPEAPLYKKWLKKSFEYIQRKQETSNPREVFNISEDYEVGIMIAIGYQDTHHVLPERLKEKAFTPRVRKSLSEIAFVEEFGNKIV